jgi:hypothetical protein
MVLSMLVHLKKGYLVGEGFISGVRKGSMKGSILKEGNMVKECLRTLWKSISMLVSGKMGRCMGRESLQVG